jgi:hypothetical protein
VPPDQTPLDWEEPVNEALWRHHLILGVPPVCLLQWGVWFLVAALTRSFDPFIYASIVHGLCFWATVVDPEWTKVVSAFLSGPEELDW